MLSIIMRGLRDWREEGDRRATILALLDMNNHQLEDIGYSRGLLEDALSDPKSMSFSELRQRSKRELAVPRRRASRRGWASSASVPCCGNPLLRSSS